MADDKTLEKTKQTLVQRFRAWGGKDPIPFFNIHIKRSLNMDIHVKAALTNPFA